MAEEGGIIFQQLQPRQEAEAVKETEESARNAEAKEGDRVYLLSNKWFKAWCQHTGFTWHAERRRVTITNLTEPGPRPGPVDCSDLVDAAKCECAGREPDLSERERKGLVLLRDKLPPYFEVREPTWQLLKQWYGVEGPEVSLEQMSVGPAKRLEVDPHPWHLKAVLEASEADSAYKSAVVAINKQCSVNDLKRRCCRALGVREDDYELMDFYGMEKAEKLENKLFKTVPGANLQDFQAVLLRHKDRVREIEQEEKEAAAAVSPPAPMLLGTSPGPGGLALLSGSVGSPPPSSPLSRSMSKPPSWAEDTIQTSASRRRGLAGLGNLGNTCFMNSSVQCLAHTVPVMDTFLSGRYQVDINTDNPLGQGGKLAHSFGSLMEKLWQGGVSSVSPKRFKWRLARFAPQFSGYAQQDSQELLAFLLDGLHEDLNRIKDKPYIEEKDDDGRLDSSLAQEAWANYRARNDSVIVDNFQGLYKSTLVCPRCKHMSRKFDPFMYLSLPLPTAKSRMFSIVVVSVDGSEAPVQYCVEVPKAATLKQLVAALGKVCGVEGDPEDVLLLGQQATSTYMAPKTEIFTDPEMRLSNIKEPSRTFASSGPKPTPLLAYRYPDAACGPKSGKKAVLVVHKSRGSSLSPAMPLFLSQEELQCVQLERAKALSAYSSSQEWAVAGPGSAVDVAIRRLLRPFRRWQEEPAAAAAAAAAETDDIGPRLWPPPLQPPLPEGDPMDDAASFAAEPMAADGDEGGATGMGEEDAMDLEQPDTPPGDNFNDITPTSSGEMAAEHDPQQPLIGPLPPPAADAAAAAAAAGPAATGSDEPFDMFAAQAPQGDNCAAAAGGTGQQQQQQQQQQPSEPYQLRLAQGPDGRPELALSSADVPNLAAADGVVFLLAEWNECGQREYNPAILDSPAKHQSAVDAEAALLAEGGKKVSLAQCMEAFLQPEQLDAEDSWYCSQCKEHVQADKKLDLWSLPEVLVVHLKRFSYSRYSRDKLDTQVDFPLEGLDLSKYLLQQQGQQQGGQAVYDLYAVSNHFGGLGGGHYTAYCKMPDDGRWYLFDDSSVREAEPGSIVLAAAYVLFYRRQGSKVDLTALLEHPKGGGESAPVPEVLASVPAEHEETFAIDAI